MGWDPRPAQEWGPRSLGFLQVKVNSVNQKRGGYPGLRQEWPACPQARGSGTR